MRMNKIIVICKEKLWREKKSRENFPGKRRVCGGGHGVYPGVTWEKPGLGTVLPGGALNHKENHILHLSLLSKAKCHLVTLSVEQGHDSMQLLIQIQSG